MQDIRQSPIFASFMQDLGWETVKLNTNYIYLKKFPLLGIFAKIPRPVNLEVKDIRNLLKNYKIFQLKIAPFLRVTNSNYLHQLKKYKAFGLKTENFPFNPTTSIQIDLTRPAQTIFNSFTSAKRRAVRRAQKNNVLVCQSDKIETFIQIRAKQYSPMGFLLNNEMHALWKNFYPKNATLLLAQQKTHPNIFLGGILLLFYDKVAYYWYASTLPEGKKLFAPTLLVWEAIKIAKSKGCNVLDFEGIYDDRFPKASKSWRGFTKFKEGFNGTKVVFAENLTWKKNFLLF